MQAHDFHLRGYQVLDFGATIVLDLVYDYAGQPKRERFFRFEGVELYHFFHTDGAIILDIESVSVDAMLEEHRALIERSAAMNGVRGWRDGIEGYRTYLQSRDAKAWEVTSSIGFDGFAIARAAGWVHA